MRKTIYHGPPEGFFAQKVFDDFLWKNAEHVRHNTYDGNNEPDEFRIFQMHGATVHMHENHDANLSAYCGQCKVTPKEHHITIDVYASSADIVDGVEKIILGKAAEYKLVGSPK